MADAQDLAEAIDEFLLHMAANGRRPSSVSAYTRELDLMRRCLAGRVLADVTTSDVSRFLASPPVRLRRDGREKAPATLNRTRAVIRTFFAWCEGTGCIDHSPAIFVKTPPCTVPVRYMTRAEIQRFLTRIGRSPDRLARRDHALFSTIAYTGLRLSEATRTQWGDLDLGRHRLLVQSAKGGQPEIRYLPRRLLRILIALRRGLVGVNSPADRPIFPSREGAPLSPRAAQYRVAFWYARADVPRKMSVHSLRHTFATLLYRETGDLLLVNRALGHRDIRSTQRYAHVEDRQLVRALNRL